MEPVEAALPCRPCEAEVELHRKNHIPFRNWCPECVMGKAKNDPHKRQAGHSGMTEPLIAMDYGYLERSKEEARSVQRNLDEDQGSPVEEEDKGMPILVVKDCKSKWMSATVVPEKGANGYAIQCLGRDIADIMGYKRVIVKADQEPAIVALREAVFLQKGIEVMKEESPVGESQSNGEAENAVQAAQAQIRTMLMALERRLAQLEFF